MEESCPWIIRKEIHFGCRIGWNNDNVFVQSGKRLGVEAHHFECVPMQVKWMVVATPIDHLQPVPLSFPQHD